MAGAREARGHGRQGRARLSQETFAGEWVPKWALGWWNSLAEDGRPCAGQPLCITLCYGYWALMDAAGYSLMERPARMGWCQPDGDLVTEQGRLRRRFILR
jgi:hypothetical protein